MIYSFAKKDFIEMFAYFIIASCYKFNYKFFKTVTFEIYLGIEPFKNIPHMRKRKKDLF
jgi:hypothetical protein